MSETAPPILEVSNLSKHFGAIRALNDFSLSIRPGEVVALAGRQHALRALACSDSSLKQLRLRRQRPPSRRRWSVGVLDAAAAARA